MLSEEQKEIAKALLASRPAVIPGTNAIPDPVARGDYYQRVMAAAKRAKVARADMMKFFDLCGIPD
jgi:hypothetical protein